MSEALTIGELFKAKAITDDDVRAAVDAYMVDPSATLFVMGDGHGLNLAEAVQSHEWAKAAVEHPTAIDRLKRAAVRTAILLARPEKR
ncbi:hypothetical protein [Methylobacterium oxalidis]|uniref:Uncharacterized protein n=1 Tax=Methylobacterium oxalidis TaxID=944322 RepID=A0A512JBY1_9HYPH|nr:hypothetical protein [Methylobacterium oxalidis]GEP07405.1 hypothetical protein MOX02_54430 [Methylobacterium oxalidis]GJE35336.1 hypothetical protein LDDCCGHA_5554 [Methylobacterium oxalidis]GLS67649.1 hypothetical protein GCM10007888_60340 [Methylobacterium oxalidis]